MKQIKRLSLLFLITIIFNLNSAQACTYSDLINLTYEANRICLDYHTVCHIKVLNAKEFQAYTYNDKIFLTSNLINNFSKDYLRAVLYHEVAHRVLNHSEQMKTYWPPTNNNSNNIRLLRYAHEYDADKLASYLLYQNNFQNKLDEALLLLVPATRRNIATNTHPSINSRVRHIRRYKLINGN